MTTTKIQSTFQDNTSDDTDAEATYDNAPISGNRMLCIFIADKNTGVDPSITTQTWVEGNVVRSSNLTIAVFSRVSDGSASEAAAINVDWGGGTNRSSRVILMEYDDVASIDFIIFNAEVNDANPYLVSSTPTTTDTDARVAVTAWAKDSIGTATGGNWDNGFVIQEESYDESTQGGIPGFSVAEGSVSGGVVISSTLTQVNASSDQQRGVIISLVDSSPPSAGVTVNVPVGALTLTGQAPVAALGPLTIDIPTGALSLTGFAPDADISVVAAVPAGSLSLSGFAPFAQITVPIPAGSLLLTGFAPTANVGEPVTVDVPAGTLSLSGFAPSAILTDNIIVDIPAGSMSLTGQVPVLAFGPLSINVPTGSLSLTGFAPSITAEGIIWTAQPDEVTSWAAQANISTTWTVQ